MSTLNKLITNVSYNALNNGITLITGFILSIVIARVLGPEQMGIYSYCTWLLGFTAIFCFLGLPNTNTRYISELNATGQAGRTRHLFNLLLLFELGAFLVVSGAVVAAAYFLYGPDIRLYILLVAANLLPNAVFAMYASMFKGLLRFDVIAKTSLIVTPVYVLAVVVGLYLGMGVGGLLILPLVFAPAQLAVFHLFLRRLLPASKLPTDRTLEPALKKRIFTFWYKLLAISLLDIVVFEKSEVFFLNIYDDFNAVAFYTIAFSLSSKTMKLIPYSLTNIMLPLFTEKYSVGDTEGQHTVYTYSLKYLFIIIAPIFAGGVFIARELITNLYGIEFGPAADIFWITLLSASLAAFFGSSASLLSAMEKLSILLATGITSICLNIGLDLLLIPRYGIYGAAWANLIGQVFSGFALFIFIIVTVRPKIPWEGLLRTGVAAAACGLIAKGILLVDGGPVSLALAIMAAAVVYPVALALVGALNAGDLEILAAAEKLLPERLKSLYRACVRILTRLIARGGV